MGRVSDKNSVVSTGYGTEVLQLGKENMRLTTDTRQ